MAKKVIYLDESASSRVYPQVVKEMEKYYLEEYGNPGSLHEIGEKAYSAVNEARTKLAKEINCKPGEIYFTSGGTESDNLAIQGLVRANPNKKKIVISSIEHAAVNETCNYLESEGYEVVRVEVNEEGLIDLKKLAKAVDSKTSLVSVMHVNNILGVVQDLEAIGKICRKKGVMFHTDAVQSFGKIKIDVKRLSIDMLSASAHKIGGPKGIGLLYVRDWIRISPLIFGGGQEKGLRSGTENVPGIVGFAKALEIQRKIDRKRIEKMRNKLRSDLERIGGKINGSKSESIYNHIHVSFHGVDNELLVAFLSKKGIYVSTGSACDSKKEKEDHVLKAIGLVDEDIRGSIRISIPEDFDEKEIKLVVDSIKEAIDKTRI